ncbi:MAG: DEAD/DEAH box helicase [Proteobacteria bacterium]|jgi:ATP-dependent RNA helicase RhlB|nr:DEAD/DEAH box helicase [Pseudomonadota bacterium]MBK7116973.1 DEAD/DEAH box helicase [Pseudomonadota bacterium]
MFRKIWNRLFGTAISAPEALQEEAPQPVASIPPPRAAKAEVAPDGPLFSGFDLQPSLAQGIRDAGFQRCTPIQAQTLPLALTGRDIAGQAQTGTGKTAAFLVSMFQTLLTHVPREARPGAAIRGIVIAPTRELAVQIHNDAQVLGRHTGLKLACVFGGVDYEKQRRQFEQGCDVLIGTPGRIIDYYKQHVFDLRHVQVCVLDEADRMFDLGFIADIRFMLRKMPAPADRQSMLFSATLSQRVLELAYEHMNNPELIRIEPDKITADKVRQLIYFPAMEEKIPLLIGLLRDFKAERTMVFVNTRRQADRLEEVLRANHINAQALSGDVPQNKRLKYMKDFHSGALAVLIATDVASRGLHIADVSHVFNFDLPQDCADYVHRIGRTARAGAEGDAISFGCEDYAQCLPDIEKYIGHTIPRGAIAPELMATDVVFPRHKPREDFAPRHGSGGGGGRGGPPRGGGGRSPGGRGAPPRGGGGGPRRGKPHGRG